VSRQGSEESRDGTGGSTGAGGYGGGGPDLPVVVKRSARRRRTVSARLDAGTLVVNVPAWFTPAQEREWVEKMRARMLSRGTGARASDATLARRARELSQEYLGGRAAPVSVRWVDNQNTRWGSATPAHGTIRISRSVAGMPAYVRDYVLLHELAHLIEPGHTPRFWGLLAAYPHLERARGYLAGYAAGRGLRGTEGGDEGGDDDADADAFDADGVDADGDGGDGRAGEVTTES
jgi:predicted metal-dependent hydrolase